MGLLTEMSKVKTTESHKGNAHSEYLSEAARCLDENTNVSLLGESYDYSSYTGLMKQLESDSLKDQQNAARTILMMERTRNFIEGEIELRGESVVTSNLGNLPRRVLDVVRIFYPNQIANELVDIQPIDGEVGTIFTMRPEYTDTFGGVNAGDEVFKTMPTNSNYASEEFFASLGTGDGSTTTFAATPTGALLPVRPGTVKITTLIGAAADTVVDDGNGNLVGVNVASGTVDYATGAFSVTYSTAPDNAADVALEYCYSAEESCENIRSLEFKITEVPVKAKMHPLTFLYTVPAGLAAKAHLAIDVQDTLSQEAAQYIKIERDHKLVKLINGAATADPTLDFDATAPAGYQRNAFYGEIELKLNAAESGIQALQGRGGVDWVLCGRNAADIFKNVKGFRPAPVNAPIGPHVIGTLRDGNVTVVKVIDSTVLDPNTFIFGYKGYMAGDSATILAEWIPIYFTPTFQSPRFKNEQGVMSMYDLFVNNAGYYRKGVVTNYTA